MLVGVLGLSGVLLAVAVGAEVLEWSDRAVSGIAGVIVVAMSALLFAFPFATPQTVGMMGIRSSIRLTRVLAAGMAALGVRIGLYG